MGALSAVSREESDRGRSRRGSRKAQAALVVARYITWGCLGAVQSQPADGVVMKTRSFSKM